MGRPYTLPRHCEEEALPDEAIPDSMGIASGKEQERPRNNVDGNWSGYETMMIEKFGKDLTPHRVKYRTLKR